MTIESGDDNDDNNDDENDDNASADDNDNNEDNDHVKYIGGNKWITMATTNPIAELTSITVTMLALDEENDIDIR